jgi:hypothetical protein
MINFESSLQPIRDYTDKQVESLYSSLNNRYETLSNNVFEEIDRAKASECDLWGSVDNVSHELLI